ncbi:hypothetical protein LguiB_014122 [Lonicera macranthoides]
MTTFTSFLSLTLCLVFLSHVCFAQLEQQQRLSWLGQDQQQQQQRPRLRARTECNIDRLTAQEPNRRFESEAGVTEFWERNDELECAGVEAFRKTIHPRGLLGIQGTVIPGCAETYETELQGGRGQEGSGRRFLDRHQKVRRFQQGDILALPAGVAHWSYNDGEEPVVSVSLVDTSNHANQLDENFRKFFLAGNPQRGQQSYGRTEQQRQHGQQGKQEGQQGQGQRGPQGSRGQGQQQQSGNIFNGFDEETLADAFNVDVETARNLQGQNDERGTIVRAEKFQVITPQREQEEEEAAEEEEEGRGRYNGLEETFCTMRLVHNIGNPSRADVFNPRGGRISHVNSQKLPILNFLQLSAERGVLYKNAIKAPLWNTNAHNVIYIIRGSGRIQVVGNRGKSVFDDQVREGQLIVVPQNFAVVKKAGNEGLDWVGFRTNDNALSSQLAGRLSAIRALPEEVLMNSYDISREEARNLKFNREETTVFSPRSKN